VDDEFRDKSEPLLPLEVHREDELDEEHGAATDSEEDKETSGNASEATSWLALQEHMMWLAGRIAARAEEAGLIAKTDLFDWEYHMQFDSEIAAAQARIAASEGAQNAPASDGANARSEGAAGGPSGQTPGDPQGGGQGEGASNGPGSPDANFGSEFGGNFGGDFGGGSAF